MKYKYILFDWDGTLAKTLDIWISAYKFVGDGLGIDLKNYDDSSIVNTFFGKEANGFKKFGVKDTDTVYNQIKKYVDEKVVDVELYPQVVEVLQSLSEYKCKLALHTSSNRNILYPAIINRDLEKYFDLILTRDDVLNPKPDPEIIYKELKHFGAIKSETLVVGDSNSDTEAAKNAGVNSALYYPKENEKFYSKEFVLKQKSNFVINELRQLLDIIK